MIINYQDSIEIQNIFSFIWISIFSLILILTLAYVLKKKYISPSASIVLGSFLLLFSTLTLNTAIEAVVAIDSVEKYFWVFKQGSVELNHNILKNMTIEKFIFRFFMFLGSICAILSAFFINNPLRKIIRLE